MTVPDNIGFDVLVRQRIRQEPAWIIYPHQLVGFKPFGQRFDLPGLEKLLQKVVGEGRETLAFFAPPAEARLGRVQVGYAHLLEKVCNTALRMYEEQDDRASYDSMRATVIPFFQDVNNRMTAAGFVAWDDLLREFEMMPINQATLHRMSHYAECADRLRESKGSVPARVYFLHLLGLTNGGLLSSIQLTTTITL